MNRVLRHKLVFSSRGILPRRGFPCRPTLAPIRIIKQPFRLINSRVENQGLNASYLSTPFSQRLYDSLELSTFSESELKEAFRQFDKNDDGFIDRSSVENLFREKFNSNDREKMNDDEFQHFINQFMEKYAKGGDAKDGSLSVTQDKDNTVASVSLNNFLQVTQQMARQIDLRVWKLAATMCLAGLSVGLIIPVMPQLMQQMAITDTEFGMIIGGFALSKCFANVPFGVLADKIGRKPLLWTTPLLVAASWFVIANSSSFEHLMIARLMAGVGVAGFLSSTTMYISDISNPLNRATSFAPISSAFTFGAAVGPGIGGILSESVGLRSCFDIVGVTFIIMGLTNLMIIPETLKGGKKETKINSVGDVKDISSSVTGSQDISSVTGDQNKFGLPSNQEIRTTNNVNTSDQNMSASQNISATTTPPPHTTLLHQWLRLLADNRIAAVLGLNFAYMFALSGSQTTILPLLLSDPLFGLSSHQLGLVFCLFPMIGVLFQWPAARLLDNFHRPTIILPATALMGIAMCAVPSAVSCALDMTHIFPDSLPASLPLITLVSLVSLWTAAGAVVATGPTAEVTDLASTLNKNTGGTQKTLNGSTTQNEPPQKPLNGSVQNTATYSTQNDITQAQALLRTVGDIGMVLGATTTGFMAHHYFSREAAIAMNGAILVIASALAIQNPRTNQKR